MGKKLWDIVLGVYAWVFMFMFRMFIRLVILSYKLPTWMPSNESIAQCSHFFIATWIVNMPVLFGMPIHAGLVLTIGWGIVKEFGFDILIEKDTWKDSFMDFCWYVIGGCIQSFVLMLMGYSF